MKAPYTRGPWKRMPEEVGRPYIRIRGTKLGGRYKIANVLLDGDPTNHHQAAEEVRANARLIEAAPDLALACHTLCAYFAKTDANEIPDCGAGVRLALQQARRAMDIVHGRTP